jgi:hypothetical protein
MLGELGKRKGNISERTSINQSIIDVLFLEMVNSLNYLYIINLLSINRLSNLMNGINCSSIFMVILLGCGNEPWSDWQKADSLI